MLQFFIKTFISGAVIAFSSTLARKSTLMAGILISLPISSILALIWLYAESGNISEVIKLSKSIFWLVIASLIFFPLLALFLKLGWNFYVALLLAISLTAGGYSVSITLLKFTQQLQ